MNTAIRNLPLLKKILWADVILGGSTALAGLFFYRTAAGFLGFPEKLVIVIAAVTLVYALMAFYLALQHEPSVPPVKILVSANWLWTVISVGLLFYYFSGATPFGAAFLILQVIVVGLLAYLEGRHVL